MTARDRWEENLKCKICGKDGVARVSQADGWEFKNDQSTRVDHCPDGFDYRNIKDGHPQFFCVDHPEAKV